MKLKILLYISLYLAISTIANAQKLPNIQENSLQAPLNVKVDGSAVEWGNKFQAYNHATDLFYTISNDDENLYLTIQVNDPAVISRIFARGVTWSIQKGNLKDDKNKVSITYPALQGTLYLGLRRKKYLMADTSVKAIDSVMRRHNKMIDDSCKFIRVGGIPEIDTLISVYNRNGIKAKGAFDNKKVYTCEFAVKLSFLNIPPNGATKFTYRIVVNGARPMTAGFFGTPPTAEKRPEYDRMMATAQEIFDKESTPTYLFGEYTLAKKPK